MRVHREAVRVFRQENRTAMKPRHAINASDQAGARHQAWAIRTLEAGTRYAIKSGWVAEADAINACDQVLPTVHPRASP
jgi:hypothetical protein